MAEPEEARLPTVPLLFALTSKVWPLTRSRTKISVALFVSPETRSLALLSNKAYWPFVERAMGQELSLPPPVPEELMLTSVVMALLRSRRKTFRGAGETAGIGLFAAITTRLLAVLANS